MSNAHTASDSVRASVRAHDHDRYLSTLFAPKEVRAGLMALYAFNADISRISETVSEPMLGEIRLQWWRDALENLDKGQSTGNPVADALGRAIIRHSLPKGLLQGVIDARVFDLSGGPMPDMQAMKAYLQKTQGALFSLAVRIIGGAEAAAKTESLSQSAGLAWGLTGLLRLLPRHLSRGRLYLPQSCFRDHGVNMERLFAGEADDNAQKALRTLRNDARSELGNVHEGVASLDRGLVCAFLPCALAGRYLDKLDRQYGDPLGHVVEFSPMSRILCLTGAAMRGRIG